MARSSWLDDSKSSPLIDDYAREMSHFLDAMADGKIDSGEMAKQEARLVALMKEVEPKLDDATHEKVTQLLCEMSAYSIMQVMHELSLSFKHHKLDL